RRALLSRPGARAGPPPAPAPAGRAAAKVGPEEMGGAASRESTSGVALVELRARAAAAQQDLLAKAAEIGSKRDAAAAQLKDLGPPPTDGRAEPPAVAAERARLTGLAADPGTAANLPHPLPTRAGQVSELVIERRRILFTDKLLERSRSVFDAGLWVDAARDMPEELRGVASLAGSWWRFVADASYDRSGAALAMLVGLAIAGIGIVR